MQLTKLNQFKFIVVESREQQKATIHGRGCQQVGVKRTLGLKNLAVEKTGINHFAYNRTLKIPTDDVLSISPWRFLPVRYHTKVDALLATSGVGET